MNESINEYQYTNPSLPPLPIEHLGVPAGGERKGSENVVMDSELSEPSELSVAIMDRLLRRLIANNDEAEELMRSIAATIEKMEPMSRLVRPTPPAS